MTEKDKVKREVLPIADTPYMGLDDYSHLLTPEQRYSFARVRQ